MRLFVTFCNQYSSPRLSVCAIDLETGERAWLPVPDSFDQGAAGISEMEGDLLVACQRGGVVRYDASLKPVAIIPTPQACSLHSILYRSKEHALYVVSTDNDTLFRYELNDAGTNVVTIEKVFCADPRRRDGDWHHLNSVTEWRRELYVAMFGTSDALAHIDRRNGRVMRLSDGATIAEGLYHPHSLFAHGDELLVVESHAHAVRRIAGGPRAEWKIEGGYPRGIVADDDMIWVGVSALRQESSSLGTPNIITSSSPLDFCTRLVELDPATARIGRTIDLSHLAAEIFDVRAMPFGATFTPSPDGGLSERIEALEESFQTLRAASKVLERRLENPFQRLKRVARRIRHRFALKAIT